MTTITTNDEGRQEAFEFVNNNESTWYPPVNANPEGKLMLYNSLTKSKVPFVPRDGNHVSWYGCGPTVYDASHLGHARNYITFDILRRIMSDYFKYNVQMVMNITDIDDKIILSGRRAYLVAEKKKNISTLDQALIDEVQQALEFYVTKELKLDFSADIIFNPSPEIKTKISTEPKFGMKWKEATKALDALKEAEKALKSGKLSHEDAFKLIDQSKDVLAILLDDKYGRSVNDPKVFRNHAAYWENDFMMDMDRLNVRRPDVLTRVSEFIPEIVEFIKNIIDNGYAYAASDNAEGEQNSSVYFDVEAFDANPNHQYVKLDPKSKGNSELLDDGEGSLGAKLLGKRKKSHFALWKASKPGEPSWPSPWGMGRPGWHIECSVMASEILGKEIDIHSGGIDLTFPHHDNELAQSEAHFGNRQWINYFLHSGHLHIEGSKMSKSLKNFISIKEALNMYSPRQMRLLFLMQRWDSPSDYKADSMNEAKAVETKISNFFSNINAKLRESKDKESDSNGQRNFKDDELNLIETLKKAQTQVHEALLDSFNTPRALDAIKDLVTDTNQYMSARRDNADPQAITSVGKYVTYMCRIFGLAPDTTKEIGWGSLDSEAESQGANKEDIALPYLRVLSNFRDQVRSLARGEEGEDGKALKNALLTLCDSIRNEVLPPLGVVLDDQEDGKALIKFIDSKEWLKQKEEKEAKLREKERQKKERALAAEKKRLEKLEKGKVSPQEMFRTEDRRSEFSEWDENGFPTKDKDGNELTKNKKKNLEKELKKQQVLHEEYLKYIASKSS
ncbi:cysteinyl-tRNA synthetase [Mycoemilia scoparia]|uniref:cysteine--tRNA ligase n=1 Tax=Mycoemilia scoparia TaxID=417184 RepID=A0A9W8A8S6_9FUNG|nr:cysteinyl-tRNA synthetase [Mycoemilia scoparia]